MWDRVSQFILLIAATFLVILPFDFNKYNFPPTLSYYIRTLAPCVHPIYYKIGSIDPKFNVNKETVIKDLSEGSDIWNNAAGKTLFIYDPEGPLTINLIFDERQSLSTLISSQESQLQIAKQQLSPDEQKYNTLVADFQTRITKLNTEIAYWNSRGGAPPDVYQQLVTEQNSLKVEANQINALVDKLNISAQAYNNIVSQLNQSAANFNEIISNKPEEGLYSPANNEIDIYLIVNHDELVHTLAHELGHALGLGHTADKNSIMYASTSRTLKPTAEDISDLNSLCSKAKKIF